MKRQAAVGLAVGLLVVVVGAATHRVVGQIPEQGGANPNQIAARVERAPLYLTAPDRYRVPSLLEPARRVRIMTTSDGILRSILLPVGATTRDTQEVAQVDPTEAAAHLKAAGARVRRREAELAHAKAAEAVGRPGEVSEKVAAAMLEEAKAEEEIAQIGVDRCSLRAPFAGRILSVPVSAGQYLSKGSVVMDLADTTSLRALIPVDRTAVTVGGKITVTVEGRGIVASVQAVFPLDEEHAVFRELAAPMALAWINLPNADGSLEPGGRVMSPYMPATPIAAVASYSVKQDPEGSAMVQVIRGERVTDVKVRVIGALGPDRTQVAGLFRPNDMLIQTSSVPLTAGTFIRFGDTVPAVGVEGVPPDPGTLGDPAVARPGDASTVAPRKGVTTKPSTKPAGKTPTKGVVPF